MKDNNMKKSTVEFFKGRPTNVNFIEMTHTTISMTTETWAY